MNDTSGFYRIDPNGVFQVAPNFVYGPGYAIFKEDRAGYSYPTTGGWHWFDTLQEACSHFGRDFEVEQAHLFPLPTEE